MRFFLFFQVDVRSVGKKHTSIQIIQRLQTRILKEEELKRLGFRYCPFSHLRRLRGDNHYVDLTNIYLVPPPPPQKSVHFLMLNISEISRNFFCKFGMVSLQYTIHRSNIKPMPCWDEIFALYSNT